MNPKPKFFLLMTAVLLVAISFAMGSFICGINRWFTPIVQLKVFNRTQASINNLKIFCISENIKTETSINDFVLEKNKYLVIEVIATGSGLTCKTLSVLENGETAQSKFSESTIGLSSYKITLE